MSSILFVNKSQAPTKNLGALEARPDYNSEHLTTRLELAPMSLTTLWFNPDYRPVRLTTRPNKNSNISNSGRHLITFNE